MRGGRFQTRSSAPINLLRLLSLIILIAPLVAGCGASVDSEQLRLCRQVIPALNADSSEIREIRYAPSALGQAAVHIDYVARGAGEADRVRRIDCGFAGRAFSGERLDLVAVETEDGALGEAQLYYLKRFWLGSAESVAAASPAPPVLSLPLQVAYVLQQIINASALCAIYALLATAYSLIYGVTGRINLAFGEVAVLGAYGAIGAMAGVVTLGIGNPIAGIAVALLVAPAFSGLWSAVIGASVIAPLHARHRLGQPILVATVGLAVAIQEFLHLAQGVRERWVPPLFQVPLALAHADEFVVTVTPLQIAVVTIMLVAASSLLWLFKRTRFGLSWRAFADDPFTAALVGVDGGRLLSATFVLAGLSAGLAGAVVAVYYGNVSAAMGTLLGVKALIAALVGGIGSVTGAFLGGLAVGLIETAWSAYFDMTLRDAVMYSVLIALFLLRPGGLFGLANPDPPRSGRAGV